MSSNRSAPRSLAYHEEDGRLARLLPLKDMEAEERIKVMKVEEGVDEATKLVFALERTRDSGRKSSVRSTDHIVRVAGKDSREGTSAVVQEQADDDNKVILREASNVKDASTHVRLTSWKTQEFVYRKTTKVGLQHDGELPTLARGLFTMRDSDRYRIVVRGYDKFFNEGEMPWTKTIAIRAYTRPPYELSFKENGCIIFIAALTPTQLIVTSKHSLGSKDENVISHAQKGEEWLDRHLTTKGRTKAELAAELWKRNETAVAELCDDAFEEHVLAYPKERTGLHLHGLNANTVNFRTRPMAEVETFAVAWGFLPTRYLVMHSMEDVDRFCHTVAETGSWQGVPIEGFVVRTHMPEKLEGESQGRPAPVSPPYSPSQTWFYKVKFDEPYLMYRDWRELTRRMLSDKEKYEKARQQRQADHQPDLPSATVSSAILSEDLSKSAKKKEKKKADQERKNAEVAAGTTPPDPPQARSNRIETKLFVQWCYDKLYGSKDGKVKADLQLFESFGQNKGIIHLREQFLAHLQSTQGKGQLEELQKRMPLKREENIAGAAENGADEKSFDKVLIVPIAVPGCGKTMLANALKALIDDFGHTQSDDVQAKKTAATFVRNILSEINRHAIVFADRNNHLFKHRNEIVDAVRDWEGKTTNEVHRVRLVALAWSLDALPLNALHRICSERIEHRGDNHQSLRSSSDKEHEQILWNFLRQSQPFGSAERGAGDQGHGDSAFDVIVRLDVNATLESNLRKTYDRLSSFLSLPKLAQDQVALSLERAREYRVSIRKEIKGPPLPSIRYYGLAIEADIVSVLLPLLQHHAEARHALQRLIDAHRIIVKPHVTLVHSGDLVVRPGETNGDERVREKHRRWTTYAQYALASRPPTFTLSVDILAWDEKAMALGAFGVQSPDVPDFQSLQDAHWRPHITLGTFSEDIRPFEANRVLRDADAGRQNVHSIRFAQPIHFTARVKGLT